MADADDDFGSFTAAERLSDPYADVYGAPAAQPAAGSSSPPLLRFSPLAVSPRSLADPFADIVAVSASASSSAPPGGLLGLSPPSAAPTAVSSNAQSTATRQLPPPAVSDLLSFSPLATSASPAPFDDVFGSVAASNSGGLGGDLLSLAATEQRATNSFSAAAGASALDFLALSDADALPVSASAPASLHSSFQHATPIPAGPPPSSGAGDDDWTDFVAADNCSAVAATSLGARASFNARGSDLSAFDDLVGQHAASLSPAFVDLLGASPQAANAVDLPSPQFLETKQTANHESDEFGGFEQASSAADKADEFGDFEQGALDFSGHHEPAPAFSFETASTPSGPELANSTSLASTSAFELPSPQSLGFEGVTKVSELKPDMYFFSQNSGSVEDKEDMESDSITAATVSTTNTINVLEGSMSTSNEFYGDFGFAASKSDAELSLDPISDNGLLSLSGIDFSAAGNESTVVESVGFEGSQSSQSYSHAESFTQQTTALIESPIADPLAYADSTIRNVETGAFLAAASESSSPISYDGFEATSAIASDAFEAVPSTAVVSDDEFDDFGDSTTSNVAMDVSQDAEFQVAVADLAQSSISGSDNNAGITDLLATNTIEDSGDTGGISSSPAAIGINVSSNFAFSHDSPRTSSLESNPIAFSEDTSTDISDFAQGDSTAGVVEDETSDDFGDFVHTARFSDVAIEERHSGAGQSSTASKGDFGVFAQITSPPSGEGDDFGDFGQSSIVVGDNNDTFNDVGQSYTVADDDFGDFGQGSAAATNDDDDFGAFGQSSAAAGDSDDDFGDFGQSSSFANTTDDAFGDFEATSAPNHSSSASQDAFGDFSSPSTSEKPVIAVSFANDQELTAFFNTAFADVSVSVKLSLSPSNSSVAAPTFTVDSGDSAQALAEVIQVAITDYVAASDSISNGESTESPDNNAGKLQDGTYIKYVLTEKIQEASQQNGIFPHGSEQHQIYLAVAAEGDATKMRAALSKLQDELFHKSVSDAMMRIAQQAALSAKAKIAEQMAQQQANAKGSSLLATTRQLLLSRNSGSTSGNSSSAGGDKDRGTTAVGGGSLGVLTPTGASVHKHSRFSFGHDDSSASDANKGDVPKRRHSGSSEADLSSGNAVVVAQSRTSSFGGTVSGSAASGAPASNSGLMKKFQDRFSSFSSARHHKARVVSLRRMGQSGEDVRTMEINMDSISGGLDEVKWKCARFLYDTEEVAHVAPAQIRILSYPGNQVLSSKSDRSALVKFLKPGAVWTIDIGASNNDMLNEW